MISHKNRMRLIFVSLIFVLLFITLSCVLPSTTASFQGDKIQYASFIYASDDPAAPNERLLLKDTSSWELLVAPEEYTLRSVADREFWIILTNEDGKFLYYVRTYEEWVSFQDKKDTCFRFHYQPNILSEVRYVANNSLTEVPCP